MIIAYKSNVTLSSKFKKFLRGGISEDVDGESFFKFLNMWMRTIKSCFPLPG